MKFSLARAQNSGFHFHPRLLSLPQRTRRSKKIEIFKANRIPQLETVPCTPRVKSVNSLFKQSKNERDKSMQACNRMPFPTLISRKMTKEYTYATRSDYFHLCHALSLSLSSLSSLSLSLSIYLYLSLSLSLPLALLSERVIKNTNHLSNSPNLNTTLTWIKSVCDYSSIPPYRESYTYHQVYGLPLPPQLGPRYFF